MKMFDKLLGKAPLFKDTIVAIGNLTKTANELVKGYTQLAKMVIEDRKAINDIYALQSELFTLLEKQQVKPAVHTQQISLKVDGLKSSDLPDLGDESKKKKEMN